MKYVYLFIYQTNSERNKFEIEVALDKMVAHEYKMVMQICKRT